MHVVDAWDPIAGACLRVCVFACVRFLSEFLISFLPLPLVASAYTTNTIDNTNTNLSL